MQRILSLWVPKTSSGAPTRDDVRERNVGTCRATYVPHSVAPAVRQVPDGDPEILVSSPIGVFGTHRSGLLVATRANHPNSGTGRAVVNVHLEELGRRRPKAPL